VSVSVMTSMSASKGTNPLFLKTYIDGVDQMLFHQMCYCSLDLFDEREISIKATGQGAKTQDTYLGILIYSHEYKLAGYLTSSGVRIAIVFDDSDSNDVSLVRSFMKKIHALYADCVSNPFYQSGQCLNSLKFEGGVESLVKLWNTDSFR
jgi:hypothetical protein